jgi:hypothetical protein
VSQVVAGAGEGLGPTADVAVQVLPHTDWLYHHLSPVKKLGL